MVKSGVRDSAMSCTSLARSRYASTMPCVENQIALSIFPANDNRRIGIGRRLEDNYRRRGIGFEKQK
jgi:hypothetical protein